MKLLSIISILVSSVVAVRKQSVAQALGVPPKPVSVSPSCKLDGNTNLFTNFQGLSTPILMKNFGETLLSNMDGMSVVAVIDEACSSVSPSGCSPQPQARAFKVLIGKDMVVIDVATALQTLTLERKRNVLNKPSILHAISWPDKVSKVPKVGQSIKLGGATIRITSQTDILFSLNGSTAKISLNTASRAVSPVSSQQKQVKSALQLPSFFSLSASLSLPKSLVSDNLEQTWC
jgi:hypothetical protein